VENFKPSSLWENLRKCGKLQALNITIKPSSHHTRPAHAATLAGLARFELHASRFELRALHASSFQPCTGSPGRHLRAILCDFNKSRALSVLLALFLCILQCRKISPTLQRLRPSRWSRWPRLARFELQALRYTVNL
jgi:hypothetical protein